MSIFPATDIVSDVARAANPRKLQASMARLNNAAAASARPSVSFAANMQAMHVSGSSPTPPSLSRGADSVAPNPDETRSPSVTAGKKFEAFILQSWLETFLPKEESGIFGSGGAAGVWRSMMAEQLGVQLADAGGIGFQKLLAPTRATPPLQA